MSFHFIFILAPLLVPRMVENCPAVFVFYQIHRTNLRQEGESLRSAGVRFSPVPWPLWPSAICPLQQVDFHASNGRFCPFSIAFEINRQKHVLFFARKWASWEVFGSSQALGHASSQAASRSKTPGRPGKKPLRRICRRAGEMIQPASRCLGPETF